MLDYKGLLPYQVADENGYFEAKECLKIVAPEINHVAVVDSTPTSITLTWQPPVLHEAIHSRTVEYGVLHEPMDFARHGSSRLLRTPKNDIHVPNLDPASGHAFSIMSRSIAGWSGASSKLIHFTKPFTPTTPEPLEVLRVSMNGLFVAWFPSAFDNGQRIDFYEIDLRPMTDGDQDQDESPAVHIKTHAELVSLHDQELTREERLVEKEEKKAALALKKTGDRLRRVIRHKKVAELQKFIIGLEPMLTYKLKLRAHNSLGNFLLICICNFHGLNHFLLICICKLHWNIGYSDWSDILYYVTPKDGVVVKEFGDDWADLEWFSPILNERMNRFVTAYEIQMCIPTGPLQTSISVYEADPVMRKNIQAVYDFHLLSDTLTEPKFRVTGLNSGVRYQFRVRPKLNDVWIGWDLGVLSDIIT